MKERTDEELVRECVQGNQNAWVALIRRYRHLIYSVIRTYHLPADHGADVFQSVCLELFNTLPRLREIGALRRWLITVTSHECLRWKRFQHPAGLEGSSLDLELLPDGQTAEQFVDIEREQMLRQAMDGLPRRCRDMVAMLFLEDPPSPYAEVASRLGLAIGSIGFIRRRCLDKLKTALKELGF
jgi:RNA polymerase sigma factor (sigma-70 family)